MRFRIAIDMDEVLADTAAMELSLYNRQFCMSLQKSDLIGKPFFDAVHPDHLLEAQKLPLSPRFFRDIPVMAGSLEVLPKLCERHEVFIASAALYYPNSLMEKYDWLKEHFPCIPDSHVIFCGAKHFIAADFLIDDRVSNFQGFSGQGLLFDAPHNRFEQGFERLSDWAAIGQRFLA